MLRGALRRAEGAQPLRPPPGCPAASPSRRSSSQVRRRWARWSKRSPGSEPSSRARRKAASVMASSGGAGGAGARARALGAGSVAASRAPSTAWKPCRSRAGSPASAALLQRLQAAVHAGGERAARAGEPHHEGAAVLGVQGARHQPARLQAVQVAGEGGALVGEGGVQGGERARAGLGQVREQVGLALGELQRGRGRPPGRGRGGGWRGGWGGRGEAAWVPPWVGSDFGYSEIGTNATGGHERRRRAGRGRGRGRGAPPPRSRAPPAGPGARQEEGQVVHDEGRAPERVAHAHGRVEARAPARSPRCQGRGARR